jgi:hypothetical protein
MGSFAPLSTGFVARVGSFARFTACYFILPSAILAGLGSFCDFALVSQAATLLFWQDWVRFANLNSRSQSPALDDQPETTLPSMRITKIDGMCRPSSRLASEWLHTVMDATASTRPEQHMSATTIGSETVLYSH